MVLMLIKLSPSRVDKELFVSKKDDVLTVNGEVFDFSPLKEGQVLPADAIKSEWFIGDVSRVDGELILTLVLPHGPNPSQNVAFPKDLANVKNGKVKLPTGDK
jgi:hypothetical protein